MILSKCGSAKIEIGTIYIRTMGLTQMLTMSDGKILILEDMETTQKGATKYIKVSITDSAGSRVYLGNILKDDLKRVAKSM